MNEDKLYSTDGLNMYIYDVKNNFDLVDSFELLADEEKDMVVVDIFLNE